MLRYHSATSKLSRKHDSSSDNDDSDVNNRDPGREVIEKNIRNRLQRIADQTKDELNKVLKRVDTTLNNYDYSVQSSLIQHGMNINDMSNVEQVADIKELENLLNDSLAKQRYKQRLMVFIVGQTEQAGEKAKLLQQIGQFFSEQKQNFSDKEFDTHDDMNEALDETDITLRSFDVKDCYIHVKQLGTRLNELNEEIVQYLVQNAGTKQQAKGKKKLAQVTKETKDQLTNLQSKIEMANTEMINKDNKIETLEKELETIRNELKTNEENQKKLQDEINRYQIEIKSYKKQIDELEDDAKEYLNQIDDLKIITSTTKRQSETESCVVKKTEEIDNNSAKTTVETQTDTEQVQSTIIPNTTTKLPSREKFDKEVQTSHHSNETSHRNQQILSDNIEDQLDLNLLLNPTDGIDLNNFTIETLPTAFTNLRKFAIIRIRELQGELEIKESINNEAVQNLKQEFDEYKITCEKEQNALIEKADQAHQLQIKAQKAAEETMNHLELFMTEQENMNTNLVHQETQTDEQDTLHNIASSPEHTNPIEESSNDRSSAHSKVVNEEIESIERFRPTSLRDKYGSLLEEKKHELDQLKQQADDVLSYPTSIKERTPFQSLENSTDFIKQQPSISSIDSNDDKENQPVSKQQQISSQRSSTHKEKIPIQMTQPDQFKLPFFHLYEIIYKFRHSVINLLEQNKFLSLADCLQMNKQLSSDDDNITNDFVENSERALKDTIKVLQTCIATLQSTINEYHTKLNEIPTEPEPIIETPLIDNQQALLILQKESMIIDLTTKYDQIVDALNQTNKKHEEESNQNESLILDQQKLIQNLQQELTRLQKRLARIETEGVVEPSIMFTRLDAERNEQTLLQAVDKGKVPESTYSELNEAMTDYVHLPSQQLSNLVKRYIHFRKVTEVENRIQSEVLDNDTKNVLEKMETLYGQRADQISKRMTNIRQQRASLARMLTEKFDHLEDESSIFLIRPVYSYQGRIAAQSYMQHEKRRRELLLNENRTKRKHHPSRQSQSIDNQQDANHQMPTPLSSISTSDDEERLFYIDKSLGPPQSTPAGPQTDSIDSNTVTKQISVQLNELTRLQEFDIQRPLLPVSHPGTTLLTAFTNNGVDPCVPSLNLRTYLALSRPGVGSARMGKPNEVLSPVLRDGLSTLSAKSQTTNPRTPFNSSAGGLRRTTPPLPPIKRSFIASVSPTINGRQHSGYRPSVSANEGSTTN